MGWFIVKKNNDVILLQRKRPRRCSNVSEGGFRRKEGGSVNMCSKESLPKLWIRSGLRLSYDVSPLFAFFMAFWQLKWSHGKLKEFFLQKTSLRFSAGLRVHLNIYCRAPPQLSEMCLMRFGMRMLWMWRKMQISSLIWILHLMNLTKGHKGTNVPRWKRKYLPVLWDLWFIFPAENTVERRLHMETISVQFSLQGTMWSYISNGVTLLHTEF